MFHRVLIPLCFKFSEAYAGDYLESSQKSKMKLYAKIFNSSQPLTIFTKSSFLNAGLGSGFSCDRCSGKLLLWKTSQNSQ